MRKLPPHVKAGLDAATEGSRSTGARVKALEWEPDIGKDEEVISDNATTPFGQYIVERDTFSAERAYEVTGPNGFRKRLSREADAFCAAQADYERRILSALEPVEAEAVDHQGRVAAWMLECFGADIAADKVERADRFIEEALELAQATGWTAERGHALVDYVFARPVGEVGQEVGGVMVTLAALCNVFEVDIETEAKREVDRISQPDIVLKIRAKQAAKPTGSALPVASPAPVTVDEEVLGASEAISRVGQQWPGCFWHLAKGRISQDEPLFGFEVLFGTDEVLATGEGDTAVAAITAALSKGGADHD